MSGNFHTEIEELAESARKEWLEQQDLASPQKRRKRISRILWIGLLLVVAEIGLLAAHYVMQQRAVSGGVARPHPLASANTCQGVKYRTFQAVVAYRRDHGRWPASLLDVVERRYLAEIPVVPGAGVPLTYARRDGGFTLECPDPVPTAAR